MLRLTALALALVMLIVVGQVHAQPASILDYRSAVLADLPSGLWTLDEPGDTAADISSVGGDNPGTYHGAHGTMPGFITGSTAFHSTNANDYVRIADTFSNGALSTNEFTFEHWLKADFAATGAANSLVRGFFAQPGNPAQFVQQNGSNISAGVAAGGGGTVTAFLPQNEWTHVVWTVYTHDQGTDLTLYHNGLLAGSHTTTAPATDNTGEEIAIGTLAFGNHGIGEDPYGTLIQGFAGGIDEVAYYDYALSADQVDAHYNASGLTSIPTDQKWGQDNSGSWNERSNWNNGIVPDGNDQEATLGGVISSPQTVFTRTDVTVKSITFHNASQYVVAGNGSLNLESNSGNAALTVTQGSHQLQLATNLATDTDADISTGGSLEFANRLNLKGHKLTKLGEGELIVSNTLNTGGGTLDVTAGTLSGGGQIGGNLIVNGAVVSPGNGLPSASAVPEPGTFVLLIIGLVGMLCRGRRGS